MKNKNLWLSFVITVGIVFLLTWVIPSTSYNTSSELVLGSIKPTGIWDIFYYISMLISWFGPNFIYLIFLGMFYGIVNRTGALRILEEKIVNIFKKREKLFLIISSSFFIIVSSLTGIYFPLFVFVPFVAGIILSLGYSKITALIATVAPIIVGMMGSLYSPTFYMAIAGYVKSGITYGWYKAGMIGAGLLILGLYLFFTSKPAKGKGKEQIDEGMFFVERRENVKNIKIWPIVTAFSVLLILFILGLTPWKSMYNFDGFNNLHINLFKIKIGSFAIFQSILGNSVGAFGTWDLADVSTLLMVISVALVLIYKIKWTEVYESGLDGIVKILPTAILVLLANTVFVAVSQSGALNTIIKVIAELTDGLNVFTYSLASLIGAALVNDSYITSYVTSTFNTILGDAANSPLLILIQQVMFGIAMLVVPTSAMLLTGLSYFGVGYTKWIKNTWKLLLLLTATGLIILVIATML